MSKLPLPTPIPYPFKPLPTITKAPLTVTADNHSKTYGHSNPPLTAAITGFVLGQNLATSGVTGAPALGTSRSGGLRDRLGAAARFWG